MRFGKTKNTIQCAIFVCGLSIAALSNADSNPVVQPIKMTACLANKLPASYEIIAANKAFKIVNVPTNKMDELAQLADKNKCGRFIDLGRNLNVKNTLLAKNLLNDDVQPSSRTPQIYQVSNQDNVSHALDFVDSSAIETTLTHLTSYYNRSASSQYGVEAANWLKQQFDTMALSYNRQDTNSYFVKTGWYKQPSLVTVLGKDQPGEAIVIGAHMDTLSGRMPGAGDDGSGSSSVLEMARVLMASGFEPKRPVYIIWYAAEERGLVGSGYVVDDFIQKNIPVKAVVQFDMTGFRNNQDDPTMWLYTDYTDNNLTQFLETLIKTYVNVPVDYSSCGYGCSDHASWYYKGIPAAFPCESSFKQINPNIHSANDTMDTLNLEHMTNFARLGIAFAIELAGM